MKSSFVVTIISSLWDDSRESESVNIHHYAYSTDIFKIFRYSETFALVFLELSHTVESLIRMTM